MVRYRSLPHSTAAGRILLNRHVHKTTSQLNDLPQGPRRKELLRSQTRLLAAFAAEESYDIAGYRGASVYIRHAEVDGEYGSGDEG